MLFRRGVRRHLVLAVSFFACCSSLIISFSNPRAKQLPVSVLRERNGLSLSRSIQECEEEDLMNDTLSRKEKILVSSLAEAGRSGHWDRVVRLWSKYSGVAGPAYAAAMQAAYHCGHYKDAAAIYDKWRNLPDRISNGIVIHRGLKIFGKLRNQTRVDQIWLEALQGGLVDRLVAAARIEAAADMGNITGAATGLDYMIKHDLDPDVPSFNSAINACRNADPPSPSAAMYVFDSMLNRSLEPTVVTFTGLMRAHVKAKSARLRGIYSDMKARGIKPDNVFAEAFLFAIFKGDALPQRSTTEISKMIDKVSRNRREILKHALSDFQASQAMTGLVGAVAQASRQRGTDRP